MYKHQTDVTFDDLKVKLDAYIFDKKELKMINKAYDFAYHKLFDHKTSASEDYITHILNVALILTSIKADYETISASLLHGVIIDGDASLEELENNFGKGITDLVLGITKINKLNFSLDNESLINNQRKILVGLSEDVRVIIIKLADRLSDMQILYVYDEKTRKLIAKETLDVLTPIADRLGINNLKQALEELSLRYLKPDEYYDIVEKLNATKTERDNNVAKMIESVSELLNKHGIKHEIKGRSKSIYSIYKKLDKGKRFSDIYDLLALRVYVNTEQECYQALGIIHSKFKPKPKRFKDYIAMPKANLYQSLHTTVFGVNGQLYEIQIRTYDMDKVAEYGIASHWSYKEKGSVKASLQNEMEKKLQFFRTIMDAKKSDDDLLSSAREEIFQSVIYVFTPLGDVIELPQGSTPIDFAYRVHSSVGDKATGAIVNSNIVPLDYKLANEDIVKIITNNNSAGPSREWLEFVKTPQAKNKIKAFFNRANKEEYLKKGEEAFFKEIKKRKLVSSEFLTEENANKILNDLKLQSMTDVYISIGSGKLLAENVIDIIYRKNKTAEETVLERVSKGSNRSLDSKALVSVLGDCDIKINLASCCHPVCGDRITGYITKGYGVTVHRMVCPNVSNLEERIVEVNWNKDEALLETSILVRCSKNVTLELISKASNNDIPVKSFNNRDDVIFMNVLVKNKECLVKFMNDLKMVPGVISVERFIK